LVVIFTPEGVKGGVEPKRNTSAHLNHQAGAARDGSGRAKEKVIEMIAAPPTQEKGFE